LEIFAGIFKIFWNVTGNPRDVATFGLRRTLFPNVSTQILSEMSCYGSNFSGMKTSRRTEITTETHEMTIIRFGGSQAMVFCESCNADTPHLFMVQAVSILQLSEPAISRLVVDKEIHSTRNADGLLLLCGNSLALPTE